MAPSSGFFLVAIKGTLLHATTTGSRIGVNLEIVFLVGLQSTLLEAYTRFLDSLETRAVKIKRYSSVDKKPGCGHDVEVVMTRMSILMMIWCQKEDYRSHIKIIWLIPYRGHIIESCDHDITIAFFLGRKLRWACICLLKRNLEWEPSKKPLTNELDGGGKPGNKWEHPSLVGKLMSLKGLYYWWKTSQPNDGRLRRKTGDCLRKESCQ